jgi:ADP-dependent phosphofructokinase/glucokinase
MTTVNAQRQRYLATLTPKPTPSPTTSTSATTATTPATTSAATTVVDGMGKGAPLFEVPSPEVARSLRTAARERQVHADALGCLPTTEAMAAAELQAAQKLDPRVTATDFERAMDRARRASTLQPVAQHVLSGFTRVIDAKFSLTPDVLSALCMAVGAPDQLLAAIDQGPGHGAIVWPHPTNNVELVASLVRQVVLGGGASMQLQMDPDEAAFLEGVLSTEQVPLKEAMGGAGAFASNLLSALSPVRPRFFSAEPLPQRIAARFSERVEVVNPSGGRATALKSADANTPARVNFSAEYSGGAPLSILGRHTVKIGGVPTALEVGGSGRVILGTRAKDVVPGFGDATPSALRQMANDTDTAFLVGTHYLTQGTAAEATAKATALPTALAVMKQHNPALVRHHQYVLPKQANNEAVVMMALKGCWDSLSMNAVEVPALVERLRAAGLTTLGAGLVTSSQRGDSEEPAAMLEGARAIADALGLPRVHLHGLYGDLVVVTDDEEGSGTGITSAVDVDRTRAALLRARQLASMKAAADSGEITGPADLFDVVPTVQGRCLAAVQRFGDAVAAAHGLSAAERADVVADWHWQDPLGKRQVFFVPSRGIHDRTGGTVSLGDTIDVSALVLARTRGRPRSHPRMQS